MLFRGESEKPLEEKIHEEISVIESKIALSNVVNGHFNDRL